MRIKELDAFRGIAAMAVVLYHYTTRYNQIFSADSFFNFSLGWLGVPLFFILSGFVIHLTIDRSFNAKDFLIRRFLRLYPTYWISLLLTLAVMILSGFMYKYSAFYVSKLDVLANFTMWHQFFHFKHIDGAYWSLLPELLFYCLMAFILFINKIKSFYWYNSILLLIGSIHIFFPIPIIGKILGIHYILLFMIGLCFYRIHQKKATKYEHLLIWLNLFVAVFLYQIEQQGNTVQLLFSTFIPIVLIFYLFIFKKLQFLGKYKLLVFLGNISYALYLVHQNIGYVIIKNLEDINFNRELSICIAILSSIFIAYLITYKIEPPFKKYIQKKIRH